MLRVLLQSVDPCCSARTIYCQLMSSVAMPANANRHSVVARLRNVTVRSVPTSHPHACYGLLTKGTGVIRKLCNIPGFIVPERYGYPYNALKSFTYTNYHRGRQAWGSAQDRHPRITTCRTLSPIHCVRYPEADCAWHTTARRGTNVTCGGRTSVTTRTTVV